MLNRSSIISGSLFLIFILIAGCTAQEPPQQKRTVLNVYVAESYGYNEGAILIAKIHIDNGTITLTQLNTYPENEKLETALREIETRPSLELFSENLEDGKLVMRSVNITPEDPNYIYALSDVLRYYGIKSVVGKETIPTEVRT